MKRNKIIIAIVCLMSYLWANAQNGVVAVDWIELKTLVDKNPKYVKSLVKRLGAETVDTALTEQECVTAFYGQAFISSDTEESLVADAQKEYEKKCYDKAVKYADKALKVNPLNINALKIMAFGVRKLANDPKYAGKYTKAMGQSYYDRMVRMIGIIALTGTGAENSPFYVTKESDEYNFMQFQLELTKIKSQERYKNFDRYIIEEGSEFYKEYELYFEITRVLELEIERYTNKV